MSESTVDIAYQRQFDLNESNVNSVFRGSLCASKNNEIALQVLCEPDGFFDIYFTTGDETARIYNDIFPHGAELLIFKLPQVESEFVILAHDYKLFVTVLDCRSIDKLGGALFRGAKEL